MQPDQPKAERPAAVDLHPLVSASYAIKRASHEMLAQDWFALHRENKQLRQMLVVLMAFLAKESENYEPDSQGEQMYAEKAVWIHDTLKPECTRCGEPLTIGGSCECCNADRREELR